MGFYGNIINPPSQTQMYFDKTYSNLAELRANEKVDGVYSGRYVLVEYSNPVSLQGTLGEQKDGGYYTIYSNHIDETTNNKIIYNNSNKSLGYISLNDIVQVNNNIIYKCEKFSADGLALFTKLYTPSQTGDNYFINFNIDEQVFGTIGRGYDSTVWQKVFLDDDNSQKYVMIAELNAVTPTFNVITNNPSEISKGVYFDGDSTNLTYNMHVPNAWDFTANTPTYNKEGFNPKKTITVDREDTFTVETKNNTTKNLVIDIPSIGNTMSDVWDNIYGKSEGNNPRPLFPIDWKSGMNETTKIYRKNGKLHRYVPTEGDLVELPLDDETGSLKALQLQMHKYLATGEDNNKADSNKTIPGAIRQAKKDITDIIGKEDSKGFTTARGAINELKNTNTNINEQWANLKGLDGNNEGFTTIYGAIDELENTNTNINDEWDILKGSNGDNKKFETIHGSLDELENTNININNEWVSLRGKKPDQWENMSEKTIYDAIKTANDATESAEQATVAVNQAYITAQNTNNTAIAAKTLAEALIGTKPTDWDGQAIKTLYDAIETGDELIGKLTPTENRIAQLEKINNIEGIVYASKTDNTTNFSGLGVKSLDDAGVGIKTNINNNNIEIYHVPLDPYYGIKEEELNIGDDFEIREMTSDKYGHITLGNTTRFSINFKGTEYFYIDIDKLLYKEYKVSLPSGLGNKYEIELFNTENTGGEGWYFIAAAATFDKHSTGDRSFELIDQPGGDMIRACSDATTNMYTSLIKYFSGDSYSVKAMVRQTSGSSLNVSVKFYCVKLPGTHEIASLN